MGSSTVGDLEQGCFLPGSKFYALGVLPGSGSRVNATPPPAPAYILALEPHWTMVTQATFLAEFTVWGAALPSLGQQGFSPAPAILFLARMMHFYHGGGRVTCSPPL